MTLIFITKSAHAESHVYGITVSPAIQQIKLGEHQSTATFHANITNNTDDTVFVSARIKDFTASSDGKKLTFLSAGSAANNTHSLQGSLAADQPQFVLRPHKTKHVTLSVTNAESLAPGGHYAAVVFTERSLTTAQKKNVTINEAVSSLVFVDTFGGGTQKLSLGHTPIGNLLFSMPNNADVVIANNGNTESVPRGYAQITGPNSNVVAQTIINPDSSMILPGSKRLYNLMLANHTHRLFGTYHLKVFYRHDGQAGYSTYDHKFVYISKLMFLMIAVVVVILISLFILRSHRKNQRRKRALRHMRT